MDKVNVFERLITVCPGVKGECYTPVYVEFRGRWGLTPPSSVLGRL